MQPCLSRSVVVPAVHGFFKNVGIIASEPIDFLRDSEAGLSHQICITAIPQFASMFHGARNTAACCFDRVLAHCLRVERRQIAMPEDRLGARALSRAHSRQRALPVDPLQKTGRENPVITFSEQGEPGNRSWRSASTADIPSIPQSTSTLALAILAGIGAWYGGLSGAG